MMVVTALTAARFSSYLMISWMDRIRRVFQTFGCGCRSPFEWRVPLGTPFLFSAYLTSFRPFFSAAENLCYFELVFLKHMKI